jgi:hypothetical protein
MIAITRNQFRILLTLWIVASIAEPIAGALTDSWLLPRALQDYRQSHPCVHPLVTLLALPGEFAALVSIIGLYRFWPCARWLSVAAWVYVIALGSFYPPFVENALAHAFTQASILLFGAVLAIVYFSPAAGWFKPKEVSGEA